MPRISIVIPTMNEEATIGDLLDEINEVLSQKDFEILIVDTDSKDRTREIAQSKGAIVIDEPRRGYGRAYKTGFEKTKGEIIVTLDADCTYPPEDIPRLLRIIEDGEADFVTGDRLSTLNKDAMSTMHRIGNWLLNMAILVLFMVKVKDSQTGMWVFKKEVLDKLRPSSDGMPFSQEIKVRALITGLRFKEIPITYRIRKGEAKLRSWSDGWNNFKNVFKLRFVRF